MMDVGNKSMRASAAGVVPSTPQFCCKPSTPLHPAMVSNKQQQIIESTDNNSSQLVLYVADTGNNTNYSSSQNQHVNNSNAVSTFQYQQGYIEQQQLQTPPYHGGGGQNYQHFQSTTTLSSNEFYHQHVRNFNNKKMTTNVMSNATATTNSIYNNKVNLFQNCYPNYVEDRNEMDPQYSSGAPTGYIATVTAVAGGSPTGNVSSSSYFSSNSSSPSTSCMTPRSTSRCDSARSAESSCSSTDSGVEMSQQLVLHQQQSSTSYPSPQQPPGNLVFVSLPPTSQCNPPLSVQQTRPTPIPHVSPHTTSAPTHVDISVPLGWRRLLVNNTIVYVSPSGAELCSREALRQYLATAGTCKCGLECPLHLDRIFSFDTKVTNRAWPLTPEPSELTRLCNHKRKPGAPTIQQAALPRSPLHRGLHSDPAKECPSSQAGLQQGIGISPHMRRRRRKAPGPYDGVLVSQLLAQRDRLAHQQPMSGLPVQQPMLGMPGQQAMPNMPVQQSMLNMPGQQAMNMPINGQHLPPPIHPPPPQHQQQYKDLPPPRSWESMHPLQPPPPPSMSQQQQQHQQQYPQLRPPCQPMIGPPSLPPPHQQQQFRQFPVSMANTSVSTSMHSDTHKQQQAVMYGGQYMDMANKAYHDHMAKQPRGPPPPYMPSYNTGYNYQQGPINNQPMQQNQWNNGSGNMAQYHNACNRDIPPHQLSWDDVSKRKKLKSKKMKLNNSCPNVDVRQMAIESKANQHMQLQIQPSAPQQSQTQQHMQNHSLNQNSFLQPEVNNGIPSFMEDPNGFLAQQTALLNSTILRQTGANVNNQRSTPSLETSPTITSSSSSSPPSSVFPLPSNVSLPKTAVRTSTPQSTVSYSQAHPISSNYSNQPSSLPDSASECQACSINNAAAAAAALAYQQASNKETVIPPDENPVTSSTILQDKASPNPDPRGPIQGGTISTSEISSNKSDTDTLPSPSSIQHPDGTHCEKCPCVQVTTMASGHTVSSNTITSVQAGRANTVTVTVSNLSPHSSSVNTSPTFPVSVTKSPLEMVQSVVSSIQVPPSPVPQPLPPPSVTPQQPLKIESNNQIIDHHQLLKTGLPPGHILVSSNGQLIMTTQPQKLLNTSNQPSVPVSSTASSVPQMIPTMNMGQPMVQLVNTLPCNGPLLLQSGMLPQTVTVEGMGSPLHLTLSGNVLHQGQLTPDERTIITNTDLLGNNMGHKKKGKKRKSPHQAVTSMLQLQNQPLIMQNFHTIPAQQQAPLLQTVTILPNNKHQFLQFPANTSPQANGSQTSPQQQAQQQFGHLLTSHQNSINLIQPLNLLNNGGGFVPNFPLQQILQGGTTLVVPSLQGLQGMVSLPDGTLVSPEPSPTTVQLQLQNVNGQQVLTSVPSQNMFGTQQNLIATPGMVIRTPGPQTQMISNKIATTGQVISQNGQLISPQSQFLVNGAFTQQTALNGLMVNTGQQVTLAPQNTSPPGTQNQTLRCPLQGDFIQCMNLNGQSMIIPCSNSQQTIPTSQSQQNAGTLLQQNTTIVQQQTTLVANNHLQQNTAGANTIINPNFILNGNLLSKPFQDLTTPLLLQKHSVSTQTAGAQTQTIIPSTCLGVASTPTSHTVTVAVNSPPVTITQPADTTTSSPVAAEPASSSTPTADCVSSSEPDPETLAWATQAIAAYTASEEEVESSTKQSAQICEDKRAAIAGIKRKHSDLLVIESRTQTTQEIDELAEATEPRNLSIGDVVWGPARGFPSWPGKLVSVEDDSSDATKVEAAPSSPPSTSFPTLSMRPPLKSQHGKVWVRWFGDVTTPTQVDLCLLKTLSEGLEAHHRATKKFRKGRKMNSQLENAIQEAMLDLDHMTSKQKVEQGTNNNNEATPVITTRINKKVR